MEEAGVELATLILSSEHDLGSLYFLKHKEIYSENSTFKRKYLKMILS